MQTSCEGLRLRLKKMRAIINQMQANAKHCAPNLVAMLDTKSPLICTPKIKKTDHAGRTHMYWR